GIQFTLQHEPSLTLDGADSIQVGSAIPGMLAVHSTQPGSINIALAHTAAGKNPANFLTMRFRIPESAPVGAEYPVTLTYVLVTFADTMTTMSITSSVGAVVVGTGLEPEKHLDTFVRAGTGKGRRGEAVRLTLSGNEHLRDLTGISFTVSYRSKYPERGELLRLGEDVAPGDALAGFTPRVEHLQAGESRITFTGDTPVSGFGVLASLPFLIPHDALRNTTYHVEVKDVVLTMGGKNYRSNAFGGSIIALGRRRGDVANEPGRDEGDHQIDIRDGLDLLRIVVRDPSLSYTAAQYEAADANCDKLVAISDVITVLRLAVGLKAVTCE
ncbi:MAG: hypothetical protein KY468_16585, partial [Armatimonadetes bacterium]|nr:hypothetical protein [Armatimonadota bacterium]